MKNSSLLLIAFILMIVSDQLTKVWADSVLILGEANPVIDDIFNLTLVYNKGVAFGMMSRWSDGIRFIAIAGVSIAALSLIFWMYFTELRYSKLGTLTCAMILAGAFGNIVDRLRIGKVIDFLDFYWKDMHWPAFNLADSYICIAVVILVFTKFKKPEVAPEKESEVL